jgi:hypothetical protein
MSDEATRTERLQKDLANAHVFRGLAYSEILKEMQREFGEEKAGEVFKRAIFNLGVKLAGLYPIPDSPREFKDWLLDFLPAEGALQEPSVVSCDDQELVVKFRRCPLKEGWRLFGLDEGEVADMCRHADPYDRGFFGSVFDYSMELWSETGDDSCVLRFRKRGEKGGEQ